MKTGKFAWVDNFASLSMRICDFYILNSDENSAP